MKAWRRLNSNKFVRDFDKKAKENAILRGGEYFTPEGKKVVLLSCPKHKRKTMFKDKSQVSNLLTLLMFHSGLRKLPAGLFTKEPAVV